MGNLWIWILHSGEPARRGGCQAGMKMLQASGHPDHGSPDCSAAGGGRPGAAGLVGRRACWGGGAGLRATDAGALPDASAGAAACGGGPVGSAFMMLTAGIDDDEGK